MTGFIEPVKSERVLVTKGFCAPYEATTRHWVWSVAMLNDKPVKGPFVGIAVMDDRGFETFAQPGQLSPVEVAA